ncbi:MAG: RNA polymerase sigma factor [Myxococcota bacterium]
MTDADAELMLRFRSGDRSAFDQLFRRYTPPLVNFLARMVPDRGRAEELAQETFVRIYQARDRYEARARFSTYLFGIAHRLALNELARAYRRRERPLEPQTVGRAADPAPAADLDYAARRTGEAVERAIAGLPERQRSALMLRVHEEMSHEDIAETLGASVSGVKSLLHRARANLAAELKETRE